MQNEDRGSHLVRSHITLTVLPIYAYVFLEWLFFITKASFTASFGKTERLIMLVGSPLFPSIVLLSFLFILLMICRLLRLSEAMKAILSVVIPAIVVSSLELLLIDNFTYTLFGFGIVTADGWKRILYVPLFLWLFIFAIRWLLKLQKSRIATKGFALAIILLSASGLIAVAQLAGRPAPSINSSALYSNLTRNNARPLPNILFIASDGIAASMMSAYGYPKGTTPFEQSFSNEALFCENAFGNVGRTYGALLSMLTGKPPEQLKVLFPPEILTGENMVQGLPQILRGLGYRNIQLTMRYYADSEDANLLFSFDQANDRKVHDSIQWMLVRSGASCFLSETFFLNQLYDRIHDRLFHIFGLSRLENLYALVAEGRQSPYYADKTRLLEATEVFSENRQPWFMHIHLMDSHCCLFGFSPDTVVNYKGPKDGLYELAIMRADRMFYYLIKELMARGLLNNTLIVISSDHSVGWDIRQRVPLMIRFPNAEFRGHIKENVQLLDVAPTILDYLGLSQPQWMTGQSLLRPVPTDRPIFGINEMLIRVNTANPTLKELSTLDPPYYGAATATLVQCDRWWDINLVNHAMRTGEVAGHTASCTAGVGLQNADAERILTEHLQQNQFGTVLPPR